MKSNKNNFKISIFKLIFLILCIYSLWQLYVYHKFQKVIINKDYHHSGEHKSKNFINSINFASNTLEKSNNGLVSVIIITKDRPDFLKQALFLLQQQTYKNFEVIVGTLHLFINIF